MSDEPQHTHYEPEDAAEDDELDGCEQDFTVDPSRNYDAERLLEEGSQDRTEHEEMIRRAV